MLFKPLLTYTLTYISFYYEALGVFTTSVLLAVIIKVKREYLFSIVTIESLFVPCLSGKTKRKSGRAP